jgi:hypothetical protein
VGSIAFTGLTLHTTHVGMADAFRILKIKKHDDDTSRGHECYFQSVKPISYVAEIAGSLLYALPTLSYRLKLTSNKIRIRDRGKYSLFYSVM